MQIDPLDRFFFYSSAEETRPGRLTSNMVRWSSMELVAAGEEGEDLEREADKAGPYSLEGKVVERDSIFSQGYLQKCASAHRRTSRSTASAYYRASPLIGRASSPHTTVSTSGHSSSHPANALVLVFHGGTLVDPTGSDQAAKSADLVNFRSSLEAVSRQHFPSLSSGRLGLRLVSCPSLCSDAITVLNSISPVEIPLESPPPSANSSTEEASGQGVVINNWPPLGCLPLFAASSPEYSDSVTRLIQLANQTYAEFIKSPEGTGFSGPVTIVGDAVGSILLYDALCKGQDGPSRFGSENSIAEDVEEHHTTEDLDRSARGRHLQTPGSRRHSSGSR